MPLPSPIYRPERQYGPLRALCESVVHIGIVAVAPLQLAGYGAALPSL